MCKGSCLNKQRERKTDNGGGTKRGVARTRHIPPPPGGGGGHVSGGPLFNLDEPQRLALAPDFRVTEGPIEPSGQTPLPLVLRVLYAAPPRACKGVGGWGGNLCPSTAVGHPSTAVRSPPTAVGYGPTAPPDAVGSPSTAVTLRLPSRLPTTETAPVQKALLHRRPVNGTQRHPPADPRQTSARARTRHS